MRIELLGTGGASATPRPTCDCHVCAQARARGVPYSRNGPAVFVHGPDLLIDTPEDIIHSLNRANIRRVAAATFSHWHPDHTAGCRVFESLNHLARVWPRANVPTPVFIPRQVKDDFDRWLGLSEQMDYLENALQVVRQQVVPDGESFTVDGVTVTPFKLPVHTANVYAFILTEGSKRVLVVPDETFGWQPDPALGHFNLVVMPMGLLEFDPFSGERLISADHSLLTVEATFRQTLDMIRLLDTERTVLVHIEEFDQVSYDDLLQLQRKVKADRPELGSVMFGFDRLALSV